MAAGDGDRDSTIRRLAFIMDIYVSRYVGQYQFSFPEEETTFT